MHPKWITFVYCSCSNHSLPSAHRLEFIPRYILIRLLCTSHNSLMSAICHVLRPIHIKQRGSKQSELHILRRFYTFFIQWPLRVVYQSSHFKPWSTDSWILTYFLPSLDCPYLTAYMYFPASISGNFPPLIYFRTYRLGCFLLHCAILTFWESTSIPCITFIIALTALSTAIVLLSFSAIYRVSRYILRCGY